MIEAVIFDLGGTLIEYAGSYNSWPELETPGFTAVYNHLAQQRNALPPFAQFCHQGFALLPVRWRQAINHERNLTVADLLAELMTIMQLPPLPPQQLLEAARLYQQAIQAQAFLVPHAATAVKQVQAAGYKVGLLSNTMFSGASHRSDLARFGLLDAFDTLLFSGDVSLWKPNAAPFLKLADMMNVKPQTAVYVGDDPASDVIGGSRAGMKTIYVKSTQRFHMPPDCHPDAEINHLGELIQILQKWG